MKKWKSRSFLWVVTEDAVEVFSNFVKYIILTLIYLYKVNYLLGKNLSHLIDYFYIFLFIFNKYIMEEEKKSNPD
jgi:hypothetical protein